MKEHVVNFNRNIYNLPLQEDIDGLVTGEVLYLVVFLTYYT
jgi:hypothetical protein